MASEEDGTIDISEYESDSKYEEYYEDVEVNNASGDHIELDIQNLSVSDNNERKGNEAPLSPQQSNVDDGDKSRESMWEKTVWASPGGVNLKKSGLGEAMKRDGNLAAPITFTPYKNEDFTNYIAHQGRLRATELGKTVKEGGNLAGPITHIRKMKKKKKVRRKKTKATT